MHLVFWTAADAQVVRRTIGETLTAMRPEVPAHRFEGCDEGVPVLAAAGEVVVVCGTRPLEILKQHGLAPKNRALNSLREKVLKPKAEGGHYLITFDPGITSTEPDKKQIIDWDVRLATRLLRTGSLLPEIGTYRWVGGFQELIDAINCKYEATGKAVDVSLDTETMGLYPWYEDKTLVSIGFTMEAGKADVLYVGPKDDPVPLDSNNIRKQVEWLLTSPRVKLRGANLKYDLIWIAERLGIECTNFKFDICLVGNLLDENRSNSLSTLTKIMTDMGGYDAPLDAKYDKGRMEEIPLDDLLPYAGGDIDGTQRVADILRDQLIEDGELARFYVKVLHPAARAFEKIERRGVVVDLHKYHKLGDDLQSHCREVEKEMLSILPRRLRLKHHEKIQDQLSKGKSPFTPKILEEYFFGPLGLHLKPRMMTDKSGKPSTSRTHLRMFANHSDAKAMCDLMEELNSASKTLSTFVHGFLNHLRPDGRLHPTYMLYHGGFHDDDDVESGTVTGRLAAKEPAIQTLPKRTKWAKRLRECYVAPPGKIMFQADFAQGELRIAACVAPESKMLAAYKEGMDLHSITAASMAGMSLQEFLALEAEDSHRFTVLRTNGKAGNFGLLYGMGAEGFQAYAWAQYGVRLTIEQAEHFRHVFLFEQWTGLPAYHNRMRDFVRQEGYVRSPLGRVRHLPMIWSWDRMVSSKAERQAINSPIQSTLSDMMLWAISYIEADLPEVEIAIMTHDSIAGYVPEANAEAHVRDIVGIMSSLPLKDLGWQPELDFPADAEMGLNLAQMKKLKLTT